MVEGKAYAQRVEQGLRFVEAILPEPQDPQLAQRQGRPARSRLVTQFFQERCRLAFASQAGQTQPLFVPAFLPHLADGC